MRFLVKVGVLDDGIGVNRVS